MVPAAHLLYNLYFVTRLGRYSVANRLGDLARKSVPLIAGLNTPDSGAEERQLDHALPDAEEGEKNLLELERSVMSRPYAAKRKDYDALILEFFSTYYLATDPEQERGRVEIEVLQR